jgi:hypothetical protein
MPDVLGGQLRGERFAQRLQPFDPVGLPAHPSEIDEVVGEHHLQQGEQQEGVGVRGDAQPLEGRGGLGAARVDHHDASTAFDDVLHAVFDSRGGEETTVRDNGIGAHHDQKIGAGQVGYRHRRRHAVEQLARDQPAVGVLGRGGEVMPMAPQALEEQERGEGVRVAERAGVAHVPADRPRSVGLQDLGQPGGDIEQRLRPRHRFESGRSAAQRRRDTVRIVVHLRESDAFLTGESGGQRMVFVRTKRDQSSVFDGGDHAAERFADPAVGRLLLGHGCHL